MLTFAIIMSVLAGLAPLLGTAINSGMTASTNEANKQMNEANNQANVEQAELAYNRSLPQSQVSQLMSAGMSRAGALNKLAGGGTYTAPVLQSGHADTPQLDIAGIGSAFDRLQNIPANVQQRELVDQQIAELKQQQRIRDDQERRAKEEADRRAEEHRMSMWERMHGRKTTELLDILSSAAENYLVDSGKDIKDFKSFEDFIRASGIGSMSEYKSMPHSGRILLEQAVNNKFAEHRSRVVSQDTHDLAQFHKVIASLDIKEKDKSLIYKLGILANQLESSGLQLDKENFDKAIRDAGFENRKEAEAAISAAENLYAKERKDRARFRSSRSDSFASHVGYTLEWALDHVNPLKGLLNK